MNAGWRIPGGNRGTAYARFANERTVQENQRDALREAAPAKKRIGSAMSDKQIATAAVTGRKLTFRTGVLVPIEGYVVGMDDYHWLVAEPSYEDRGVQTTLIHKSCPLVTFTDEFLAGEIDEDRQIIRDIGGSFWTFCVTNHLSRSLPLDHQEPQK